MGERKKCACRWCGTKEDVYPDSRLCEQCDADVIHCVICKADQHADDHCRHVFQDSDYEWNGAGTGWTPGKDMMRALHRLLDAMPPGFASDLRNAIKSKRFHTWLMAPLIGSGGILEMHGMPYAVGLRYGDALLALGGRDDADDLRDGYRWLVSLYDGKTLKANRITLQWIDQWSADRFYSAAAYRWADDGGSHP